MAEPLTHFDPSGAARMVAVTDKPETARGAVAEARVRMAPATLERIREGQIGKGDVLAVARLAAIAGAKQTPQLIPLCHPVRLTGIDVDFVFEPDLPGVRATVRVSAVDRTGPEMEAMTAAAAAALTIYDMCKAIDRGMTIESVYLVEKSGGKSGVWTRGGAP
ncbi:cyclic pyranopterin monophosphate synthase MoaC [Nannocystis punicea]|uniref:Cyclic pyranopterin monophosphate synthase n=1 Tax=Nannocystis punicea TaxID=2995304 RepID=A0ABY7GT94_9BACT|nr:cyclic pyranopterin monophosphate synthase MoaC [Nannocystis poenicansa]WAS90155.1 cyclic pyranopterin monophosphate synthase MoaC [Nannocystis poenicansa]